MNWPNECKRRFGLRSSFEAWAATFLFTLQLILKIWDVFRYRFDSDEPQHLHVVWAWTHGLVQYRDVFDNHMPFFQLLCAPLLALMGEHARDLYWMRLLMLPLYFLSAYFVFRIGALVFSRRIGAWAAIGIGCWGKYFFCTTEFRTDNLWALFWLISVYASVQGGLRWRRALVAGLLLGLAFAVSMKSTVMLLALAAAWIIALSLVGGGGAFLRRRSIARSALAFLVATVIPPLAIVLCFAAAGVWPQMRYCVFEHNLGSPASTFETMVHLCRLPAGIVFVVFLARKFLGTARSAPGALRRAFLCATCGMYLVFLLSFWRHVTRQDYLPYCPLLILLAVAGASEIFQRRFPRPIFRHFPAPAWGIALALFAHILPCLPRQNDAAREFGLVRRILKLTRPHDVVFDCKGETVFRPRAVYEVFEGLTIDRINAGKTSDHLPQSCAANQAGFATVNGRLPPADHEFISHNYLSVGHGLRVAGSLLRADSSESGGAKFSIAIPGAYEVLGAHGKIEGLLDGLPYDGVRFLAAGMHDFRAASPDERLAVIWAQAAERHLSPFRTAQADRAKEKLPSSLPIVISRSSGSRPTG